MNLGNNYWITDDASPWDDSPITFNISRLIIDASYNNARWIMQN